MECRGYYYHAYLKFRSLKPCKQSNLSKDVQLEGSRIWLETQADSLPQSMPLATLFSLSGGQVSKNTVLIGSQNVNTRCLGKYL